MASVGSSHNRSTPAEDQEEVLLRACPALGLLDERSIERFEKKDRALYPRPETPRLYGHEG
jgi:hypothetical protein